ncbi:MAG: phosphate ABC transporter permease subunit PstC [Clostridiales Family XIII bacterium]|jgi:phosphate transport system permease protein|nr:phosphate ABC transporter permease subunit PstC [Clostridiales Family XIII bacterium]
MRVAVRSGFRENLMGGVFLFSALASIGAVGLICYFLFVNGIPAILKIGAADFLFGQEWAPTDVPPSFGILPMIVGSLYVTAGAIVIGVPLGVLTALFMAFVCPKGLYRAVKPGVDLLAGIPSVVYGFFGMAAIVPLLGNSILSACVLLGVMILPTIIGISESALRAVPDHYYEGALALGAGHYRTVFSVMLPAAKSGVLAAAVLGVGRAIGETMAVIMVAGNQARMPVDLFKGVRTLTANIVIEMGYAEGLHREALIATGVVLFVFILLINLSFTALKARRS